MKIAKIILYDEPTVPEIELKKAKRFLNEIFPIQIEVKDSFFQNLDDHIFEKIAETIILDLKKKFKKYSPTSTDISQEKEKFDEQKGRDMILHEGFEFQKIITDNIPVFEDNSNVLHIIFTDKMICTFDESDWRYHARSWIGPNPAIISTTGMVEAPAKPRQYYFDLMTKFSNENITRIEKKYKGLFLEHHDLRLSKIIEGYLLQIISYYETGEPFCKDKTCRLFNAHWQEELLSSQVENKKICKKHKESLNRLKK